MIKNGLEDRARIIERETDAEREDTGTDNSRNERPGRSLGGFLRFES